MKMIPFDVSILEATDRTCRGRRDTLLLRFDKFRSGFIQWLTVFCRQAADAGVGGIRPPEKDDIAKDDVFAPLVLNSVDVLLVVTSAVHALSLEADALAAKIFIYPRTPGAPREAEDENKPYVSAVFAEGKDGDCEYWVCGQVGSKFCEIRGQQKTESYEEAGQYAAKAAVSYFYRLAVAWKEQPLLKSLLKRGARPFDVQGFADSR